MPSLKFRVDAAAFREDMSNVLKKKAKGITSSYELYDAVSWKLVNYIRQFLPEDTGALAFQKSGQAKNGLDREGYLEVSKAHGIDWTAIEHRKNGDAEYAKPVIGKYLGIHGVEEFTGADIQSRFEELGIWDEFLEDCKPLIVKAMKNG